MSGGGGLPGHNYLCHRETDWAEAVRVKSFISYLP